MNIFKKIEDFNRNLVGVKRDQITPLSLDEAKWQIATLKEEITEFEDALKITETTDAIVAQADALMDLLYFTIGGFCRLGINHIQIEQIFKTVHKANMNKIKGKKSVRDHSIELDAIKPDNWVSPEKIIKEILFGIK